MGPEEEEIVQYCLTSTVMLTLTTDNESSGSFNLSGSIRRQVFNGFCSNYIMLCFLTFKSVFRFKHLNLNAHLKFYSDVYYDSSF